jgi:mycofactocin system glycosyltransferase
LPAGFGIALAADTRFVGSDVVFGGSPLRLLRLNPAGQRALRQLRGGTVGSADSGRLARRLTDAGLAHPRPPLATQPADATVVIPVRDRAAELDRCLDALGPTYPVLVVDDGSADPAAVARVCERHGARLLRRSVSGGPGPARNDGLAPVATRLIAFLDSDCVGGSDWITRLAAHFSDPVVAAVAPRVRPLTGHHAVGRYLEARAPLDMGGGEARVAPLTRLSYVPTAALLVRREALAALGQGFDPGLRYGEDVDLIWRLMAGGWRVRYDPAVEVGHVEPDGWPAVLARRFRYGTSAAPLARRHPGQVPPLLLPAWPTATVAALLGRRPLVGLAAFGAGSWQLVGRLRRWGVPTRSLLRPEADSVYQTWLAAGRWSIQYALPALFVGMARPGSRSGSRSGRNRMGRRLAVASLLAGPPAAEWLRTRPRLDPLRFSVAYLADEAAYGLGVYRGAIRERSIAALLPRLVLRRPQGAKIWLRAGATSR